MSTPPQSPQPGGQPAPQPEQPQQAAPQPAVPAQPTAYPYPHPQSPPAGAFYAQPTLVGGPGPGHPQHGNPYAQTPSFGPVPPLPPSGGGGAGRAVLWAVVGAVVASAAWAAGVFLIGARSDSADLRGYSAPSNLCSGADYSSFKDEYPQEDSAPTRTSLKDKALDEGYCSLSLKKSGSSYADAYLTLQLDLHKKTDPGPEFTAGWKNYGESHSGYDVDPVQGIGDEAYLISEDTVSGSSGGSRYATLAVRDGWVTYVMTYSLYLTSYSQDKNPPALTDITGWLKTDARATLRQLRD
ncbi:hypothetical protein ABZ299_34920 [Streptomyces sp. NPDC006184]|uniref:hypothetical protein n=1 Tax=Streptomyces sp. NPDC006184 TaxID=3155455 RepID=UPI0033B79A00